MTEEQFNSVFSNQPEAAGTPSSGAASGATGGGPASGEAEQPIIPNEVDGAATNTETMSAANDNHPVIAEDADHAIEPGTEIVQEPAAPEPEAANDNPPPSEELPATGTQ